MDQLDPQIRACDGGELGAHLDTRQVNERVFGVIPSAFDGDDFGNQSLYEAWYRRNPDIYSFLLNGDRVVGYANFMPLDAPTFQESLAGRLSDGLIDPSRIRTYDEPGLYSIYLCCVAVMPEYRQSIGLWTFAELFRGKLERLRRRGIEIGELAAVAWTEPGRLLCQSLGMRRIAPHFRFGDVYHGTLSYGPRPEHKHP